MDSYLTDQAPLIRAAAKAGVKWLLPTEFGSDPAPSKLLEANPMVKDKRKVRDLVEELSMNWIVVVTNPWFDWTLARGFWGIDIGKRSAKLFDGGEAKFVTTTIGTVAKATAGLLSLPQSEFEAFRNRPVYLKSFHISQRDMLDSILRATGTEEKEWNVEVLDAAAVVADCEEKRDQGDEYSKLVAFMVAHMREGWGGDYNDKVTDMGKLGVAEENLDQVVTAVIEEVRRQ